MPPNSTQCELEAESGEFYDLPTTHLIATVEDLTDMLDYALDDNADDADDESGQVPPITGRWTATSTYDVYMVDSPNNKDDEDNQNPDEDKPVDEPPKR